jgi:hypothetical protein
MKYLKLYNESLISKMVGKSNEDILKSLDKFSNNQKIITIIKYNLPYELLPRNKEGICIYNGNLYCSNKGIKQLPDNLTIKGDLFCNDNYLTELPNNLVVKGNLDCNNNLLTKLPDNLKVKGSLDCRFNELIKLPENLVVKGNLDCRINKVKLELPESAKIKGKFYN